MVLKYRDHWNISRVDDNSADSWSNSKWGDVPAFVGTSSGGREFGRSVGRQIEQREVVDRDEPRRDGVFNKPRPATQRKLAAVAPEPLHPDSIELFAHVVELAPELRDRPAQSCRGIR